MNPSDVRAFVERDWMRVGRADRAHWAAEYEREGPSATLNVSQALWRHKKALDPGWPDEGSRALDLAHHIAFKRLLDRAGKRAAR